MILLGVELTSTEVLGGGSATLLLLLGALFKAFAKVSVFLDTGDTTLKSAQEWMKADLVHKKTEEEHFKRVEKLVERLDKLEADRRAYGTPRFIEGDVTPPPYQLPHGPRSE